MKPPPFRLERYFAEHEFRVPWLLSASDCEPLALEEVLDLADAEMKELWKDLKLGYTESAGHPLLRLEAAALCRNISPDEVLTVVPEEGIFIAMNVLPERGDHVVVTFPGYQSLYSIAEALGCSVSRWRPHEEEDGWHFDTAELEALITAKTRLIVLNTPHNPTGAHLSREELDEVVAIARRREIYLFSDEMYRYLEHDPAGRLPDASSLYDRAVSLSGMSKSFALAGLRTGWLTTRNKELYRQLAAFKDYTTICGSAPAELLAVMALRAREEILDRNLSLIRRNLALLDDFFARHADLFSWPRPKAGTVAFPRLKGNTGVNRFCDDLRREKGVLLLPAEVYDHPGNHFRIGFAREDMPRALEELESYIRKKV